MSDHNCYADNHMVVNHPMYCLKCGLVVRASQTGGTAPAYSCLKCKTPDQSDLDAPQMVCMQHTGLCVDELEKLSQGQLLLLM